MNALKRILSVLLVLCLVVPFVPAPVHAAGDIAISTKEDLLAIGDDMTASYYLTCDIVFTEADFASGGDFYNNSSGWKPLGEGTGTYGGTEVFSGTLDGNGYSIIGLVINATNSEEIGLFCDNYGTIRNLTMTGGSITAAYTNSYSYSHAGSIAGINNGTIEDCHNENPIHVTGLATNSSSGTNVCVGGIAGSNDYDNSNATISGCSNSADITAHSYGVTGGGIVGINHSSTGSVTGCFNSGNLNITVTFDCRVGGVIGDNAYGSLTCCGNSGSVTAVCTANDGQTSQGVCVGGVTGTNFAQLSRCYNTGDVTGSSDPLATSSATCSTTAGGVTGYCSQIDSCSLDNCFNTGNVSGTMRSSYSSYVMVGGIVGKNFRSGVSCCYTTGTVSASGGRKYTGQLTGYNGTASTTSGSSVTGSTTNCVYQSETSTASTALTANEMTVPDNFTGFDFSAVWTMEGNPDYPFPELQDAPTVSFTSEITSVSLYAAPDKTDYVLNELLDLTGGQLKITYNSGVSQIIDMTADGVTVGTFNSATAGTKTVSVKYGSFSTTFKVTVHTRLPVSIGITTLPDKTEYRTGEALDLTGGILTIYYTDDTTEELALTDSAVSVTGFNSALIGKQTLTIAYSGMETALDITISCSHSNLTEIPAVDATCTETGFGAYYRCSCGKYFRDSSAEEEISGQEDVVTAPLGHSYGEWIVSREATCTEDGMRHQDCVNCGHSVEEIIAAKGHRYESTVTEPTCTEGGYTTHICSVCGDSYVDSYTDMKDHAYEEGVCTGCGNILYVQGDVNGDGNINILDANLAASYYNEVIDLTDVQLLAADVNGDGIVNILDANLIAAYYNEIIDTFPAEKD